MDRKNFTVLRGGLLDSAATSRKEFVSAYVTNTRLMGSIGMYIHFRLPDNLLLMDLHQFFAFEAEEYGFESYESVLGSDEEKIQEAENTLIGGLGGEKIPITQLEAEYLLQEYVRLNKHAGIPLPDGYNEYRFLLEQEIFLSEPDLYILMRKQCGTIESPYELINYFLMRVTGRDFEAAAFLTTQTFELDLFPNQRTGTFCKNTIDRGDTPDSYICESLMEFGNQYYLAVTELTVSGTVITSFKKISFFRVTPAEAAMMLSRSEFITVYEMTQPSSAFAKDATPLTRTSMPTLHDSGTLYMMFHTNNQHVARREYLLNEDVLGVYFVSNAGQLIAASYSLEEIHVLEKDLSAALIGKSLVPRGKFEFQEPVLYEFIQSGFLAFEDFIEAIRSDHH